MTRYVYIKGTKILVVALLIILGIAKSSQKSEMCFGVKWRVI